MFRTCVCVLGTEEKYTWVLGPNDLIGKVGLHYLVVRPIVKAGVKSVNATVTVTSIAAQCKYWNETLSTWSEDGCRVSSTSTTQHLIIKYWHITATRHCQNQMHKLTVVSLGWSFNHAIGHSVLM